MYKKRFDKTGKRIMSVVLAAVMAVPLLAGVTAKDMSKVQAATSLKNPSIASNGVATWDCVYFGRYPQSDATGKKSDPIKWRVLSVNGNDAYLMSDCNLDARRYNETWDSKEVLKNLTWDNSTIRSWLNGYGSDSNLCKADYSKESFMSKAFAASEQAAIMTTTVTNSAPSHQTADKVFLLSYEEATNPSYGFSASGDTANPARSIKNTAYVAAGGSYGRDMKNKPSSGNGYWRLRNLVKEYPNNAMYVGATGIIYQDGYYVDMGNYTVCPVLHLNLSDTTLWSYAGTVSSDGSSTAGEVPPTIEVSMEDSKTGTEYVTKEEPGSNENTVEYSKASEDMSGDVVIPETVKINGVTYTVTSVADNAFKNNKKIKKVVIGNNVKVIGENAFMGCSNLQSVTMGKNVTTIKAKAFYKCTKLKKITIPSKVNKIGKQAFYGCKNLKTITIKTTRLSNKNVGSKAFKGIHSKATIKIPKKKFSAYKKMLKSKGVGSKAKIKK
ncbi:MAG: leucine-rich repeat protein [Clostridiales bacterium]|nr:leucine-rich repeat protein [Clostridiales bacterium]